MRCRVGDLAVKVGGLNIGMLVEVLKPHMFHRDAWHVRVHSDALSNLGLIIKKGEISGAWDKELKPIRDPGDDAKDETLLWAGLPNREEVEQ